MSPPSVSTAQEAAVMGRPAVAVPVGVLAELAEVVQRDLLAHIRGELCRVRTFDLRASPARIAGYAEDGLALLTSYGFELGGAPDFSMERIEACRSLAECEPRFRYIYRLPDSAGWGAAIGATVERALFGNSGESVRTVTALLNVFMTLLDGLLDEAPEIIKPQFERLLGLVRRGAEGDDVAHIELPGDHPYNDLCFAVAKLWIAQFNRLNHADGPSWLRQEFLSAVIHAMQVELTVTDSRFEQGPPSSSESLYGRTRWPLWTQALTGICEHPWPLELKFADFRELIFRIGDFAAYLDDVRDFVADCRVGQWNTVSRAIFVCRPFDCGLARQTQARLLLELSDRDTTRLLTRTGLALYNSVEKSIEAFSRGSAELRGLLTDLAYAYLE